MLNRVSRIRYFIGTTLSFFHVRFIFLRSRDGIITRTWGQRRHVVLRGRHRITVLQQRVHGIFTIGFGFTFEGQGRSYGRSRGHALTTSKQAGSHGRFAKFSFHHSVIRDPEITVMALTSIFRFGYRLGLAPVYL